MARNPTPPATPLSEIADPTLRRRIDRLCKEKREYRDEMKRLEELDKNVSDKIKEVAPLLGHDKVQANDWMLLKVVSRRSAINAEKLLQLGVPIDVIEAATTHTESETWQVRGVRG